MKTYALVCGCDYSGSWKVYQSCNDAKKFYNILRDVYQVKRKNIKTLYNNQFTRRNILKELDNFSKKLNEPGVTGIIYVAGHGTSSGDRNNDENDRRDENWQTYDRRCVVDDEITSILSRTHKDSNLTVISDCCHSGTVLDFIEKKKNKFNDRNWLSIGSALDNQSAIQSGDGSVCSVQLFKILHENHNITMRNLIYLLKRYMEKSFIGTMQTCVVNISNENLYDKEVFYFTEKEFRIICIDDNLVMK